MRKFGIGICFDILKALIYKGFSRFGVGRFNRRITMVITGIEGCFGLPISDFHTMGDIVSMR